MDVRGACNIVNMVDQVALAILKKPVQARKWSRAGKWSRPRNDPRNGRQMIPDWQNGPRNGRQMIPAGKWSPEWPANDPEVNREQNVTWTAMAMEIASQHVDS